MGWNGFLHQLVHLSWHFLDGQGPSLVSWTMAATIATPVSWWQQLDDEIPIQTL